MTLGRRQCPAKASNVALVEVWVSPMRGNWRSEYTVRNPLPFSAPCATLERPGHIAIAFRIRWSRRGADINIHYPWIPGFAGRTDRNLPYGGGAMPQSAESYHDLAGASRRGCARLRRCLGRPGLGTGRGLSRGGRPDGGQGEFGKFDFPAIVGHFRPLYLTVGGGCSFRVGFGIGVALGELGAGGLLLVFRHQTSRGLSGGLDLVLVIWEAVSHVFRIVYLFC